MIGWQAAALLPAHDVPIRYRTDGFTPDRQRAFLVAIAEGQTVEAACRHVGVAPSSAYALRQRAAGASFALGWRAASLHARERLASAMWSRALEGVTETTTRPDGSVIVRHRYDNRLAMAMLTRLDKLAAEPDPGDPFGHAARTVHLAFEDYLDMVEHGTANDAAAFLLTRARREIEQGEAAPALAAVTALRDAEAFLRGGDPAGAPEAPEEDQQAPGEEAPHPGAADLALANRQGWTNDQWTRAEAAGLVTIGCPPPECLHSPPLSPVRAGPEPRKGPRRARPGGDGRPSEDAAAPPAPEVRPAVWTMPGDEAVLCTRFPAPPGFDGLERGRYGEDAYWRACTGREAEAALAFEAGKLEARRRHAAAARDAWFSRTPDDELEDDTLRKPKSEYEIACAVARILRGDDNLTRLVQNNGVHAMSSTGPVLVMEAAE